MVVRDLRARRGQYGQQRGLADIGETHQPHIRDGLELERHAGTLPWSRRAAKTGAPAVERARSARCLCRPCRRSEPCSARPVLEEIGKQPPRFGLLYNRAHGHFYDEILAAFARAVAPRAVRAVLRAEMLLNLNSASVVRFFVREEDDIPALAAVAAVGSAVGHITSRGGRTPRRCRPHPLL